MPAGTGVCVVNTVPARDTSSAASKRERPPAVASVSSRIRSRPRKPAWPSLVWNTSGSGAPVQPGEDPDRPHAADAEQHLLPQPVLGVAAVQPVGDGAETSLFSSTSESSSSSGTRPTWATQMRAVSDSLARQPDLDLGDRAVGLPQQRERQPVGVEHRVGLLLPAVAGERLPEVAVPVEQADADDRHAEVARGLEVVAGEDAEAAGVLRQHRGDAELRREVGDRRGAPARRAAEPLVPAVAGEVLLEVGAGAPRAAAGTRSSVGELLEPAHRHGAEAAGPGPARRPPSGGVDGLEEVLGLRVPGPAQVAGELAERAGAVSGRTGRTVNRRMALTGAP